jgi:hypothetical protein
MYSLLDFRKRSSQSCRSGSCAAQGQVRMTRGGAESPRALYAAGESQEVLLLIRKLPLLRKLRGTTPEAHDKWGGRGGEFPRTFHVWAESHEAL